MTLAAVADSEDRLPWLENSKTAPAPSRRSPVALLVAAIAGGAIALAGSQLVQSDSKPEEARPPVRTIALPPPAAPTLADAEPQGPSESERAALAPVASEPAAAPRRTVHAKVHRPAAGRSTAKASVPYDPRAWKSGIAGRIIQLGAFRTSRQAHSEWKRVYYRYPLLRPLPPRVLKSRIGGRIFYRLQLGTFSQAHSELLCQRLKATGQGCIVLGLPKRS